MAPVLLPPDPERSRRLRAVVDSADYLATHRQLHRGEFVVVKAGVLVSADSDPNEALRKAREAKVDLRECLVQFVPGEDSFYYY